MSKEKMKSYSAELKEREVKLALKSDQSVAQTARDLGVNENTLHTWLSKYHQGGSGTSGPLGAEHLYEEPVKAPISDVPPAPQWLKHHSLHDRERPRPVPSSAWTSVGRRCSADSLLA